MRTPLVAVELAEGWALPKPADPGWQAWLSPGELSYCLGLHRSGEHLAARLAAKRAVCEALGWPPDGDGELPWQQVLVRRGSGGAPEVVLRGELERWRRARGLPVPGTSLSHAAGHAVAVAWLSGRCLAGG